MTLLTQPTASHYINGAFVEDSSGSAIESIHPATGEVIATVHAATPSIVDQAVRAAQAAQPVWAAMTPMDRGRILRRASDLLRARMDEIARLETLDTGKPIQETSAEDITSAADCLEYFAGAVTAIAGETIDMGASWGYTRREPLGICAGIGAWNYPIQIAAWKTAPALACGNAMVFKPSEVTPLTALVLAETLTEAGLPAGLFSVIQGRGETGAALAAHPDIAKISVTGSVPTGKRVMETAAGTLKQVTCELGGKSPLIVFDDASLENAVSGALLGNFYSSGQVCTNGTRVFVQNGIRERFLDRLLDRTKKIRLGDPLDPETQMGPLVNRAQYDRVLSYIEIGKSEGAGCVTGGDAPKLQGFEDGLFVSPTIFTGVTDDMTIAREEIFGPVMSVLDFEDEDEVVSRANKTDLGLAAGVFTTDLQRGHRVISRLQAGTCWLNTYNLAPIDLPFGGYKQSGIGRENSRTAIEHYTQIKSVYVETGDIDAPY
ncbi:MAG: betaine-aldehyde dehydrogenase [Pseudomonadota bacterium]